MGDNLRTDTFRKVALHLDAGAVELQKAADALKDSEYWANTSEYLDIVNLIKRTKSLSKDFYQ
jgi:hypothetical protein